MTLRIGQNAPDFKVSAYADGTFKDVKLEDYRGKWVVLFFYPADFTFVCPTELVGVAKQYENLKKMDVEVLAVSTDSHFVHMVWQETELSKMVEGGLPFPMLYDAGGRIGQAYNVYDEDSGMDIRGTFIIDPDGVLQASEVLATNVGRSAQELVRKISAFQVSRESGGVIPCDWHPGEKTLKPGQELVGKVYQSYTEPEHN
ncbi:peroxiredoxin [bacterium]|nr:peroxiredoxin [bacterium]